MPGGKRERQTCRWGRQDIRWISVGSSSEIRQKSVGSSWEIRQKSVGNLAERLAACVLPGQRDAPIASSARTCMSALAFARLAVPLKAMTTCGGQGPTWGRGAQGGRSGGRRAVDRSRMPAPEERNAGQGAPLPPTRHPAHPHPPCPGSSRRPPSCPGSSPTCTEGRGQGGRSAARAAVRSGEQRWHPPASKRSTPHRRPFMGRPPSHPAGRHPAGGPPAGRRPAPPCPALAALPATQPPPAQPTSKCSRSYRRQAVSAVKGLLGRSPSS